VDPEEIRRLLAAGIDAEEIQVSGDGRHFDVLVVSKAFEGLRPVKKQQLVYGILNERIADGSLHAVNMKTLTPAEYAAGK
jgi:acid stress-induced BolA-like protein IbaG/YrbA